MAQDKTFDFTDVTFPEGSAFDRLKKHLANLATSRHLRATLDSLIRFILETEKVSKDPNYQDHWDYLLTLLDKKFYPLADALCDEDVTLKKLLLIRAKRKITTSYLPNHFLGQEPEFVPLDTYQGNDNAWEQQEKRLKKKHLLQTAASLDPLFKKTYPLKSAKEQNTKGAVSADSSETRTPHLLKLRENYLEQEALAKMISNFRVRRFDKDADGVELLLVYQLGRYRDFSLPGFDEADAILAKYRQAYRTILDNQEAPPPAELKNKLLKIDEAFLVIQQAFEEDKKRLQHASKQDINFAVLQYLAKVRHTIWTMSKDAEKIPEKDNTEEQTPPTGQEILANSRGKFFYLNAIRKALVAATPYHPGQLSGFLNFIRENPDYFSRHKPNSFLRVNYFHTDEQREKYRVHIIKGKCYRTRRSYGKIEFVPFSTAEKTSHRKKGWVSFVMNRNGEIFAGTCDEIHHLHHSSFMAGAAVFFPGEMKTAVDGTIQEVSNYSGHYGPNLAAMEAFACHLSKKRQVDVSNVNFYAVDAKGLQDSLDEVEKTPDLPEDAIKKAKEHLENQSEELKSFRRCYRLVDGKFNEIDLPVSTSIPVDEPALEIKEKTASSAKPELDFKRVVWIGALAMMVVIGVVLAATAILATKGIAAPFIGGLMIKAAALGSTSSMAPALPAVGTVATLLIAVPTLVLNNIFGFTQSLGKWLGGLFGSKNSEAQVTRTNSRPVEQVAKTSSEVPAPNLSLPSEKKADQPSYPSIVKQIIEETEAAKVIAKMAAKPVGVLPAQTMSSITRVAPRKQDEGRTVSTFIGQKRKYGEWTKFESDMDQIAHKDPNNKHGFAIYLNWLKSDLDDLQKKVLRSQDSKTLDSKRILEKWAGENVVKLMLDVAYKLKDEQEFLGKVEEEFFKPLDIIIAQFWQPFQTKPVNVLRAYQLQCANVLVAEPSSVVTP